MYVWFFSSSLALNQDEWRTGLKALEVDSLVKLKKAVSRLDIEVFVFVATVAIIVKLFLVDKEAIKLVN